MASMKTWSNELSHLSYLESLIESAPLTFVFIIPTESFKIKEPEYHTVHQWSWKKIGRSPDYEALKSHVKCLTGTLSGNYWQSIRSSKIFFFSLIRCFFVLTFLVSRFLSAKWCFCENDNSSNFRTIGEIIFIVFINAAGSSTLIMVSSCEDDDKTPG